MSVKNLEGVIHEELFKLFLIRDGFSVGEKLTQIEKTAKKKFYNMSNEEIYDTIRELSKAEYHNDEKGDLISITEEQVEKWRQRNNGGEFKSLFTAREELIEYIKGL